MVGSSWLRILNLQFDVGVPFERTSCGGIVEQPTYVALGRMRTASGVASLPKNHLSLFARLTCYRTLSDIIQSTDMYSVFRILMKINKLFFSFIILVSLELLQPAPVDTRVVCSSEPPVPRNICRAVYPTIQSIIYRQKRQFHVC